MHLQIGVLRCISPFFSFELLQGMDQEQKDLPEQMKEAMLNGDVEQAAKV